MYTGLTAKITLMNNGETNGTDIAYISNWSVEETRDMIEVTTLGSKYKEKVPSLYAWTASAEGTAQFNSTGGQSALRKAMLEGTKVNVKFFLNDETYLQGTAYVESFSVDISAEDKGNVSISLTGDGALTASGFETVTPAV